MPTRTTYRRALARRYGGYETLTVEAATNTTNATITSTAAFKSSLLPSDHLDQAWIYVPSVSAPAQRRVQANGLAFGTGVITLDGVFGTTPATSSEFEIHRVLPAASNLAPQLSNHAALNMALQAILIPRTLTLNLVSGQYDYDDLQAYDWLDRDSRLVAIRVPNATNTTTLEIPRHEYRIDESAGANVLHFDHPFRFPHGTYTVTVEARSPADRYINGAESTAGLSTEADTAIPQTRDVVELALLFCYAELAQSEDGAMSDHYTKLLAAQIPLARSVYGYDKELDVAAMFAARVGGQAPAPQPGGQAA